MNIKPKFKDIYLGLSWLVIDSRSNNEGDRVPQDLRMTQSVGCVYVAVVDF